MTNILSFKTTISQLSQITNVRLYLVVKNASGLLRGQYSKLLFVGLPQFGESDDWINSAVNPRAAST